MEDIRMRKKVDKGEVKVKKGIKNEANETEMKVETRGAATEGNTLSEDKFKKRMKDDILLIEGALQEFLPAKEGEQKIIFEAMEYSVMGGGKRIRPMIMLESYRMFAGENAQVTRELKTFMTALEMIHNYSLVHDDLPAMDDDEYRRGRLTTHKVYGAGMATLAGDALLNYAFEIIANVMVSLDSEIDENMEADLQNGSETGKKTERKLSRSAKAFHVLSSKAGIFGMIGGQVVDVGLTGKEVSKEQIEFIHKLKTAALLEAPFMIGAILAGASDEEVKVLEKVGENVGLAFQIQDDVLDFTSGAEVMGKSTSDKDNNKSTYYTLLGEEKATETYVEMYENIFNELGNDTQFSFEKTRNLIMSMKDRKK
jgi:geranylgeranyl diphosphate synthase type II